MNHRYMFGMSMAFLAICLVITTNALTMLFTLFVMGIVPGTSFTIPAWVILVGYPVIILIALGWLMSQPLFIGTSAHNQKTARSIARKRVARRTQTKPRLATTRRRSRATS